MKNAEKIKKCRKKNAENDVGKMKGKKRKLPKKTQENAEKVKNVTFHEKTPLSGKQLYYYFILQFMKNRKKKC